MKTYRLDSMPEHALAFDLETHLIQPGLLAPPMVLGSYAEYGPGGINAIILDKAHVRHIFDAVLLTPSAILCGANIAYDMLVLAVDYAKRGRDIMPEIFAMYDAGGTVVTGDCDGRVFEIQLAEGLHAIAEGHLGKHALSGEQFRNDNGRPGRYSLKHVTTEVLGREDAKVNDRFRLSYGLFDDKPLSELPFEARQYPIDDARNTLEDALAQAGHIPSVNHHEWVQVGPQSMSLCRHCQMPMAPETPQACMRKQRRRNLGALSLQTYYAWAAHAGSAWGLHVPQDMVDALEKKVDDARDATIAPFKEAGIIRDDDTENQNVLKRLVATAYGARDVCPTCAGSCKVPSPKTNGKTKINCPDCDGVGLRLTPQIPRSDGGGISKNRDALFESGNELLMEYAEQPSKKIKTTYIPLLRRGRACNGCGSTGVATKYKKAHEDWCSMKDAPTYRAVPLTPRVDPLKETLRASVEDGLHGIPRKGGIRECIRARPGYLLSSVDWTAGELMTLAEAAWDIVGWSRLGDALNSGLDVHLALAGTLAGKDYATMLAAKKAHEKWVDPFRQVGKKSNFGFGGRMAELTFVLKPCRGDTDLFTPCENGPLVRDGKRGYAGVRPCIMLDGRDRCGGPGEMLYEYYDRPCPPVCRHCIDAGKRAREAWYKQWPEMRQFHAHVKGLSNGPVGPSGTFEINYEDIGIVRGGLDVNNATNGYFQIRLAKAAKAAFCQIQRECMDRTWRVRSSEMMQSQYDRMESPLYGSRAVLLFHDESICEHPESVASDAAKRSSEIMIETLRFSCPRLFKAIAADPALMRALLKGAQPKYARGGDKPADPSDPLIPWEP